MAEKPLEARLDKPSPNRRDLLARAERTSTYTAITGAVIAGIGGAIYLGDTINNTETLQDAPEMARYGVTAASMFVTGAAGAVAGRVAGYIPYLLRMPDP